MVCASEPSSPILPRRRTWLGVLVVAWGIQAIVTQSLLLREALVLMFGSEFAWGVVLFAWLFGVAVGAGVGGWVAPVFSRSRGGRGAEVALVTVLLLLSAAAMAELWVFRGARAWLGVAPGELLPLSKTAVAAMLFISPTGALVGVAFPLACCIGEGGGHDVGRVRGGQAGEMGISPRQASGQGAASNVSAQEGVGPLGRVYACESFGSLIGGAAFSFWAVEHLAPIQTALLCGAITAAASAGLLAVRTRASTSCTFHMGGTGILPVRLRAGRPYHPKTIVHLVNALLRTARRRYGTVCLSGLAGAALLLCVFAGGSLDRRLVLRRWRNIAPGYELCVETESKYQNLAVGRRAGQYSLYLDGHVSTDFPDQYTFVPLAHFWMSQHPAPRRVLVLGGGAEGLLAEILLHPVEHVDYIEPDSRQIELIEPYLPEADRLALADARVTVHHLDARYFVKTQRDRFDLVIARLPEPTSALRARLYTDEFYGELRRAMTDRSVLCMTAAAAPADLPAAPADYVASIRATLRRHFPQVTVGWGGSAQVLAATDTGLVSIDPAELARRYADRGVQSALFHPLWFEGATDWLDPDKLRARSEQLDAAGGVELSTDLRPAIYMQRLALWEQMTGGSSGLVVASLRSVGWAKLVAVLAAVSGATLLACRLRGAGGTDAQPVRSNPWAYGTIVLSVGTTGFATMALSIIWLFAFQNLYGYVYQRIGWIIALFMAGLVIGCWLVSVRSKRMARRHGSLTSGTTVSRGTAISCGTGVSPVTPTPSSLSTYLWRRLIAVDVLLALLALSIPFVLPALGGVQETRLAFIWVEWAVSIMVALTGVLGGAAFALAGGLQLAATGSPGAAAGSVVGADHAGACAGALLTGLLLVPVFGTAAAAYLLVGIKLGSAALLVLGHRPSRVV